MQSSHPPLVLYFSGYRYSYKSGQSVIQPECSKPWQLLLNHVPDLWVEKDNCVQTLRATQDSSAHQTTIPSLQGELESARLAIQQHRICNKIKNQLIILLIGVFLSLCGVRVIESCFAPETFLAMPYLQKIMLHASDSLLSGLALVGAIDVTHRVAKHFDSVFTAPEDQSTRTGTYSLQCIGNDVFSKPLS